MNSLGEGNDTKEKAVNLGVACSLLCLAVTSRNEIEKMKELQGEVKDFLREIKGKGLDREPEEVIVGSPNSCLTDAEATLNCNSQRAPSVVAANESILGDWPSGSRMFRQDCMQEMEKLEAELEVELEKLQLHLHSDSPSTKHVAKTEDLVSATSGSTSMRENMNHREVGGPKLQSGVPPVEIERKLHELLQSRQQERIKELETAMESYEHEIHEKDKEISWWRDTAMLLSRHTKELPREVGI